MPQVIPLPARCPECGATLSQEEKDLDECWSCGWPESDTPLAEHRNLIQIAIGRTRNKKQENRPGNCREIAE